MAVPTSGSLDRGSAHGGDLKALVVCPYHGRPRGSATSSRISSSRRRRVETETDFLVGRREDLLRRQGGDWRIARRKIVLDQSVLLAKNLTMVF